MAAKSRPCTHCGEPTDTSYGVCSPCLDADLDRSCAEQGVPRHIEDPALIARVIAILRPRETGSAA